MRSTKSSQKPKANWQFEAIGTNWAIETPDELSFAIKETITKRIDTFDRTYSRFRDDSLVSRIAAKAGTYEFPTDVVGLIALYKKLYAATDGAMSPLIGDSLSALGYDKKYSLRKSEAKKVPKWDNVMQWHGRNVTTNQSVELDFGAAGKGYLVDIVADILRDYSINRFVIDASGDIRVSGDEMQTIGLENPSDSTTVIGTLTIQNASLCASATNRRQWGDGLHHVIDGRTGKPTNDIVATWVVAATAALADGVATGLFFAPAEQLAQVGQFQFVRLHANGYVEYSPDIMGELYA